MLGILKSVVAEDNQLFPLDMCLYMGEIVQILRIDVCAGGLFLEIQGPTKKQFFLNSGRLSIFVIQSDVTDTEFRLQNRQVQEAFDLKLKEVEFSIIAADNGYMSAEIQLLENIKAIAPIQELFYNQAEVYDHMLAAFNLALGLNQSQLNKLLSTKKPIDTLKEYWNKNKK